VDTTYGLVVTTCLRRVVLYRARVSATVGAETSDTSTEGAQVLYPVPRADKWDGMMATAVAVVALALIVATFVLG
jgi:hypothetical protein